MDLNFVEELLNFSSDIDEEEVSPKQALASSLGPNGLLLGPPDSVRPWNSDEEELEWISNKDAFPAVESFMGLLPGDHRPLFAVAAKDRSPVSVLDDATTVTTTTTSTSTSTSGSLTSCFGGLPAPPRRSRTKRRPRTAAADDRRWGAASGTTMKKKKKKSASEVVGVAAAIGGRKCQHCGVDKTPQWRAGPGGPKTLCNACGVRYKSGRLVPEYRPASSPTFSAERHSNSHRRIMEMRRVKGLVVKPPLESG